MVIFNKNFEEAETSNRVDNASANDHAQPRRDFVFVSGPPKSDRNHEPSRNGHNGPAKR